MLDGQAILPEHLPEALLSQKQAPSPTQTKPKEQSPETKVFSFPVDLEDILAELEKHYLLEALGQTGGAKKQAAELLGLNFRSFRYRLKKYDLEAE